MTTPSTPAPAKLARAEALLAKHAEGHREVIENRPWGHRAFKVKGKTFLFLFASGEGLSLSVKLPESRYAALELPFTEPTHYGLGKSGWVTANLGPSASVPLELFQRWIDESYRAIAPKKLLAEAKQALPQKTKTRAKSESAQTRTKSRTTLAKATAKSGNKKAKAKSRATKVRRRAS